MTGLWKVQPGCITDHRFNPIQPALPTALLSFQTKAPFRTGVLQATGNPKPGCGCRLKVKQLHRVKTDLYQLLPWTVRSVWVALKARQSSGPIKAK
jgi:hypothetical protein